MSSLTRAHIIDIVGRIDDERIARMIQTGATEAELLEAWTWLAAKEITERDEHRRPLGRAAELCEILSSDEPPAPEERA